MKTHKYKFYELSVQTPKEHAAWFVRMYHELRHSYPRRLREDFCGTFALSAEWVRRNSRNSATGLDLDPEPLEYGRRTHLRRLSAEQRERLTIRRADVTKATTAKSDIIAACNFSFYCLKKRSELVNYFRRCRGALRPGGILILESAGGPGMIEPIRESRKIKSGASSFLYVWDQQHFDPISHDARYAIHFRLPGGKSIRNAFTYDWRLYTIPEVREALLEAGFEESCVYWETEHRGKGTGEFARTEKADNAYAWIAYIIGMASPAKATRRARKNAL